MAELKLETWSLEALLMEAIRKGLGTFRQGEEWNTSIIERERRDSISYLPRAVSSLSIDLEGHTSLHNTACCYNQQGFHKPSRSVACRITRHDSSFLLLHVAQL